MKVILLSLSLSVFPLVNSPQDPMGRNLEMDKKIEKPCFIWIQVQPSSLQVLLCVWVASSLEESLWTQGDGELLSDISSKGYKRC